MKTIESISITKLKENCIEIIEQVSSGKKPVKIADNHKNEVVLLDIESYEELLNSANLNKMIMEQSGDHTKLDQPDDLIEQCSFFKEFKEMTSK